MVKMKYIMLILLILLTVLASAVMHEIDMARNFKNTGDANAWFFDIKCTHEK